MMHAMDYLLLYRISENLNPVAALCAKFIKHVPHTYNKPYLVNSCFAGDCHSNEYSCYSCVYSGAQEKEPDQYTRYNKSRWSSDVHIIENYHNSQDGHSRQEHRKVYFTCRIKNGKYNNSTQIINNSKSCQEYFERERDS